MVDDPQRSMPLFVFVVCLAAQEGVDPNVCEVSPVGFTDRGRFMETTAYQIMPFGRRCNFSVFGDRQATMGFFLAGNLSKRARHCRGCGYLQKHDGI